MKEALTVNKLHAALGKIPGSSVIEIDDGRHITKVETESYSALYPSGRIILTLSPFAPKVPPVKRFTIYEESEL